ncbi:MAG: phosphoglycerate kinase [Patescibacteria group bacterium]
MRNIKQIKNLKGKRVLVRVDFNVPIKNEKVLDDFKIRKTLPTIKFLQKKGAEVILISHLGKDGTESMKPVADCLKKYIKKNVILLDNIRKFSGEMENDLNFAKKLSKIGDVYVNDAFASSHRAHASIVGLPKFLPSYAGFQLEREIKNLSKVFKKPKHPLLFILGGAKFSTKIPLIQKYLKLADYVFVGGALASNLLKAKGYEIGKSLVNNSNYNLKSILKDKKLILPEDVVVKSGNKLITKKIQKVKKDEIILDIGFKSVKNLMQLIKKSKLIFWNGPLGKYEDGGGRATKKLLKLVSGSKAESIIGGGDIVSLVSKMKLENKFTFVSTGGGSMLEYLAKGTLPGIKALE